jgi:hypothetical protein
LTGQEWPDVGVAGVCGAGCGVCGTVRTGSPDCGRAECVVPAPGRPSVGAGTGTVSSAGVGGTGGCAFGADCPGAPWAAPACPAVA